VSLVPLPGAKVIRCFQHYMGSCSGHQGINQHQQRQVRILTYSCRAKSSSASSGCTLLVEMWFPELEAPSSGLAAALARLGATVRLLPHAAARAGGFTMKAATILLSGFEQVTSCQCLGVNTCDSASCCQSLLPCMVASTEKQQ
jgi:hypothetical protein